MRKMYSKKQIETMSVGAVKQDFENSDILVNTLSVKEPNWELDLTDKLNTNLFAEGSSLYAKIQIFGKELYIVISGRFVNGADVSLNTSILNSTTIDIPDEIASKIYRADGTKLTENPSSLAIENNTIVGLIGVRQTSNLASLSCILRSDSPKSIKIDGFGFGTHNQGSSYFIDLRTFLII